MAQLGPNEQRKPTQTAYDAAADPNIAVKKRVHRMNGWLTGGLRGWIMGTAGWAGMESPVGYLAFVCRILAAVPLR